LPRLADFLTLWPPRFELAKALFLPPPPFWTPPLRRWPSDRATARWPPPVAIALVLLLLRLAAPRTLCFFTSRAGLGVVNALLGFAVATSAPGRLGAGLAASALARGGLGVARVPAPSRRWSAGRAPADGSLAASPGASARRLTDAGAIPATFAPPSPSEATR